MAIYIHGLRVETKSAGFLFFFWSGKNSSNVLDKPLQLIQKCSIL